MENIDIKTLKLLSQEIIQEESQRINKPINYYPVTKGEFCQSYVFKQNKKLMINSLTQIVKSGGFND